MSDREASLVVVAPNLDREDVGETGTTFRLLEALASTGEVRLTVLALHRPGRVPVQEHLPDVEVVSWSEPGWLARFERFNAMVKPAIPPFFHRVRRWISGQQARGRRFDLLHQMLPRAPRYPSPLPGLGVPYIIGPVGGALPMPEAFRDGSGERWFTRLRSLDSFRFAHDPWLRRSYAQAELVLGVAPYMSTVLRDLPIRRFEPFLGIGVDALPPPVARESEPGHLSLLFVGRAVRTKGLREAVRALALLPDLPEVTLTVAGDGEEIKVASRLASAAGIGRRVRFLGKVSRAEVESLYETHDVLVFPSFRESMGGVLYEAMRWGMPVVTVDRGGPGYIVDGTCGVCVPVTTPEQLPRDLAHHLRRLALDVDLRSELAAGARTKVEAEALWPAKAGHLLALYRTVMSGGASRDT